MPLDRRITLTITDAQDDVLELYLWAEEQSAGSSDIESGGVVRTSAVQNFLVRHDERIARAAVSQLAIRDRFGHAWQVDSVSLSNARDRFISIQAIREVTDIVDVDPGDQAPPALTFTQGAALFDSGSREWRWFVSQEVAPDAYQGELYDVESTPDIEGGIFASWNPDADIDLQIFINRADVQDYSFGEQVIRLPATELTTGHLFVFFYDDNLRSNPDAATFAPRGDA
ncbi:MAG: hypothetical protein OXE44_19900 [Nitrospinae bacterium]|nr:hypothetical protein [Nitrospinota bacterium]